MTKADIELEAQSRRVYSGWKNTPQTGKVQY